MGQGERWMLSNGALLADEWGWCERAGSAVVVALLAWLGVTCGPKVNAWG